MSIGTGSAARGVIDPHRSELGWCIKSASRVRATFPSTLAPILTTTRGRFCITASFGSLDGGHQIYQRPPTTRAGHIHDRMPMTVTPDNREAWLDPGNNSVEQLVQLTDLSLH
jgi:hypothetical protein